AHVGSGGGGGALAPGDAAARRRSDAAFRGPRRGGGGVRGRVSGHRPRHRGAGLPKGEAHPARNRQQHRRGAADLQGLGRSPLHRRGQHLQDHPGGEQRPREVRARGHRQLPRRRGREEESPEVGDAVNLQERWGQLEEREKKLLVLLMALVGAMVVLVVPMGLSFMLSSEREENRAIQEAITSLRENRAALEKRAAERDRIEARYARKAPSLPTFVAQTANQSGLDTPETQDRAMVPHGKHFEERGTQVRFRQVGMLNLATFMEKVENSGYALTIT